MKENNKKRRGMKRGKGIKKKGNAHACTRVHEHTRIKNIM